MDTARRVQLSYDRVAATFFERNGDRSVLLAWMKRFAALACPQGVVVDLGAGPCFDSAALRALGLTVLSLDRSHSMLALARERFPGPRVQADLRQLPLRSASLAGVWASASLLHLRRHELEPALSEIARVLAPRGALFLSLKDGEGERWDTASYGEEAPRFFAYWSASEIDGALGASGFEPLEAVTRNGTKETWHIRLARKG